MTSLTLYCLPHAGGSPVPFVRRLAGVLTAVRLVPLDLPGHGGRMREPLATELEPLVADLVRTIDADGEGPYALFGHSLGALLAYELAHRLRRPPAALLVAGRNGPGEPLAHRPIHHLPDDAFIAGLRRFGGVPDELLNEPDLLQLFMPALRADLRIAETYERPAYPRLDVPVAAFAGRRDPLTDPAGMLAWERESSALFELALVPGGHFFLDRDDFQGALAARLTGPSALGRAAALTRS
ncbi:alpha/beta fold hydrolase [Streptomyces sp. NPDC050704]|uniref:thioesterase II family protein n=1 Tax=Streptomyces sp. NPDC050704 TaxID=3157219 RepID=UPI003447938A